MSEAAQGEPGAHGQPVPAGRLAARYDQGEDRIVLHLPIGSGGALRFWMTRRVTEALLRSLSLVAVLPPIDKQTPGERRVDSSSLSTPSPPTGGAESSSNASRTPRGESPMLVRAFDFAGGNPDGLLMFKARVDRMSLSINIDHASIEPIFRCLAKAALAAEWRLNIPHLLRSSDAPTPAPS